ncbi:hypothetical protein Ahy_B05g074795 [Arachis hypogaea]|uniref:Endonuclease/exonuclease/phosphatase domain-containing protein n=1 Tax=Arachis hypogaea TaxID=3818 RepID=A0A444YZV0_ARAHY|nr:hypothetical protein Ahy_B05g074795 [Arachis hypogaea]
MIIPAWNVKGAASSGFKRTLRKIYKQNKPDIVILLETKFSEAHGFSGGIWIYWNDNSITITPIETDQQYIHTKIEPPEKEDWFMTDVALLDEAVQKIIAQPPSRSNGKEDRRGWKLSEDDDFSVVATYRALAN